MGASTLPTGLILFDVKPFFAMIAKEANSHWDKSNQVWQFMEAGVPGESIIASLRLANSIFFNRFHPRILAAWLIPRDFVRFANAPRQLVASDAFSCRYVDAITDCLSCVPSRF